MRTLGVSGSFNRMRMAAAVHITPTTETVTVVATFGVTIAVIGMAAMAVAMADVTKVAQVTVDKPADSTVA